MCKRRVVVIERGPSIASETTRQAAGQIGQLRTNPVLVRAVQYTLDLMSRFQELTGHDPYFTQTGSLHIALTEPRAELFARQMELAAALQIEMQRPKAAEISHLVPALDQTRLSGAVFLPDDGYVEAEQCALAYAAAARDLGVEIRTDCELKSVRESNGHVEVVETTGGAIECGQLVVTVGPWARLVLARAGVYLPTQPIRLQQARTATVPDLPEHHPVVRIPDESCYLRPERGGYLYGFFDQNPLSIELNEVPPAFTTGDIEPEPSLVEQSRSRLAPVLPILEQLDIDEYRQGMVGGTPDGHYVLGPVPGLGGAWVATGCGGMGIAGSAAVGRWLARWIMDGDPGDDLRQFAPERFGEQSASDDWVRQRSEETFRNYYALPADN
jgi:glycine/D-amino acid oxidase-like deaminating enzyme